MTYRGYIGVLDELRMLLDRVDEHIRPFGSARIEWSVRHREYGGGLLVRLEPWRPPVDRPAASLRATTVAVVNGISTLERGPAIPRFFSEEAVRNVERAGARRQREGIERLSVAAANGTVRAEAAITPAVVTNAARSVTSVSSSIGSVEGVLDVLNARGRQPHAGLLDSRTRRGVRIDFPNELRNGFHQAFGKRVAVGGDVIRNHVGQVIRVRAKELMVLPEKSPKEDLAGIIGAAPGWTSGVPLDEFIAVARRGA